MKKIIILFVIGMLSVSVAAQDSGEARVRFANFIVGSTGMSATIGNDSSEDVPLGDASPFVSDYFPLPSGQQGIGVTLNIPGSFGAAGFSRDFIAGRDYLVVAVGNSNDHETFIIEESLLFENDPTLARVLLLFSVADVEVASVSLANEQLKVVHTMANEDDAIPGSYNALSLTPGDYQLALTSAGNTLASLETVSLQADTNYMIVFAGNAEGVQVFVELNGEMIAQ